MKKAEMTPRERVFAAMELKEPDRVPLFVSTRLFGISYIGKTIGDVFQDADIYVQSQLKMVSDFQHDAVWDLAGMNVIGRVMGQKMLEAKEDVPPPLEPLLKSPGDLGKMPPKVQVKGQYWSTFFAEICRGLKKAVGEEVAVIGMVESPFLQACTLRGAQNLYIDMYERPDYVKELLDYVTTPILEYSDMLAEAGADIIYTACPVASRTMISRKHYEQFVHPSMKQVIDYWKNSLKKKVLFHTCGDWKDRYDLVVDEGPNIIHVDKIDLGWLKKEFGNRVCINGNVGSTTTMMLASAEEVKKEAIECIKKAAQNGGYMMGADCMVPKSARVENMRALTEAVMEAGTYPLKA